METGQKTQTRTETMNKPTTQENTSGGSPLTATLGSAGKAIISEETFRSPGRGVNETDDMVRVTIDMPVPIWRAMKKQMFTQNTEHRNER